MIIKYNLSLSSLKKIACLLQETIKPPFLILLEGGLGNGKTTFAQFFIQNAIADAKVVSPSFGILHEYQADYAVINHFDFYRLLNQNKNQADCHYFIEHLENAISLIEWPAFMKDEIIALNYPYAIITINMQEDCSDKRTVRINSSSEAMINLLNKKLDF